MGNSPDDQTGSLAKGLRILAAFDEKDAELTVAEISHRAAVSRASVYRLAATLEGLGYLRRDGTTYQPSTKVFDLGIAAVESLELVDHIRPYLDLIAHELPDATAVNYGVLEGVDIIYLLRLHRNDIITINLQVGSRVPAYLSSLGKAILAAMPIEDAEIVIEQMTFKSRTPSTIDTVDLFRRELELTREAGVAVNDEELTAGLRSVAAPIFLRSHVVGAIGAATLATKADLDTLRDKYGEVLRSYAERISRELPSFAGERGKRQE